MAVEPPRRARPPVALTPARRDDPRRDLGTGLPDRAEERRLRRRRDEDLDVDAVEHRPSEPVLVAGQPNRRATTPETLAVAEPARTRVCRQDQLEPAGEPVPPGRTRHDDLPRFDRLTQCLDDGRVELGRLVEEQHAVVRLRDCAGQHAAGTATDHRDR